LIKNILSNGLNSEENKNNEFNPQQIVTQDMYCLINKIWLKKWKKHVGYKEIKNKINENKIERDLDNNDYKWISKIIDKNYKENYLNPLDNNAIYKNNKINPLADFKVIHNDSFNLFTINFENSEKNINFRRYPIRFFKDKYILFLSNDIFFIAFKMINSIKFNEIIVDFIKVKEKISYENISIKGSKKKVIDIIFYKDINEWLKEINFNFFEIEKEVELHNCLIKIYNKTFLLNKILNANNFPNDSNKIAEFQSSFTKLYLSEIRSLDNNSKIGSKIVFENINKKNNKTEENYNKKKQKINSFNNITNNIIIKTLDNYNENQIINSNNNNDNDNGKIINNNSKYNYKKSNIITHNSNQPNFSQNQNNIFNCNNNLYISHNDKNIDINYNNNNSQNQVQNNNNIIQINQKLINNINSINQQNNLTSNFILKKQDKKKFEKNLPNKEVDEIKLNEINELKIKINELEKELKQEKNKNKLLEENIIILKNKLDEIKNNDKDLIKSIEMKNININELSKIIIEKEKK